MLSRPMTTVREAAMEEVEFEGRKNKGSKRGLVSLLFMISSNQNSFKIELQSLKKEEK